jgi:hypothetical protein
MRIILLLLTLLFWNLVCSATATDSLLSLLKLEIRSKAKYDNAKLKRIKALQGAYTRTPAHDYNSKYVLCDKLYHEYRDFIFDSAHVYAAQSFELSKKTNSNFKQHESWINLSAIQLTWGMFKEAFEGIKRIKVAEIPDSLKAKYYELKSIAYNSLALYNTNKFYVSKSRLESVKALDSAILYSNQTHTNI